MNAFKKYNTFKNILKKKLLIIETGFFTSNFI